MTRPLRIALLTHSTNPRGGVIHALSLGDALAQLGHGVVAHAPDSKGQGFFRPTRCNTVSIAAKEANGDLHDLVEMRVAELLLHFEDPTRRRFDIFHAGDGITGAALAILKERGAIAGFARTVHHLDFFADPRVAAFQRRSIETADEILVVSEKWRREIASCLGRTATLVGNGVEIGRFTTEDGRAPVLRRRLGLGGGPLFLSIGGVEERKNSFHILEAFIQVQNHFRSAQLIIAGGASLLDHQAYQQMFAAELAASGLSEDAVGITGPLPDADMPALYRIADALVFPSLNEGFGLVVLEAMASGTPAIVSRQPPFTEYIGEDDALWCDPASPDSIAEAMVRVLAEPLRSRVIAGGHAVAARHDWGAVARNHLAAYARLMESAHA